MPAGTWAFLQETVIYEYMMHRFRQGQLYLKQIICDGKPVLKNKSLKVSYLEEITDTYFPDIKKIKIAKDDRGFRPAEVKFITSTFDYHKKKSQNDVERYKDFINQKGCIVVLRHDYLPRGILDNYNIDVFELDLYDFISFGKENFVSLLNQQIKSHEFKKIWLMYKSKNFWCGNNIAPPAKDSGRWCPTENLTSFNLSAGDKVIFFKTSGCGKHIINSSWYRKHEVPSDWKLDELCITQVTHPIQSREEYCKAKGIPLVKPLWYDETDVGKQDNRIIKRGGNGWRWQRVFEFKNIFSYEGLNIDMKNIYNNFPDFVKACADSFADRGSREISQELYISIIEFITSIENARRNQLINLIPVECFEHPDYDPTEFH